MHCTPNTAQELEHQGKLEALCELEHLIKTRTAMVAISHIRIRLD